jgi:hypothetical protein
MLDPKVKNVIHRWTLHLTSLGHSKAFISSFVAHIVKVRGPIGTGKYACTCNNWGPRWGEDSEKGCCDGCFAWALDHHQEMKVNGVKPVTMGMIERSKSWGFNVAKLHELRARRKFSEMLENRPLPPAIIRQFS